ncbi:hypothetical protein ACWKWU_22145 [Chitinophaga lutea]
MKRYLLIFSTLLSLYACAQKGPFEGSITYTFTDIEVYDSTEAEFVAYMTQEKTFTIYYKKDGSFVRKSADIRDYTWFDQPSNKIYRMGPIGDWETVDLSRRDPEDAAVISFPAASEAILGHVCKSVSVKSAQGEEIFSWAPGIAVADAARYARVKTGGVDSLYKMMGAHYLARRNIVPGKYAYTEKAVKITPGKVPDSVFLDISKIQ